LPGGGVRWQSTKRRAQQPLPAAGRHFAVTLPLAEQAGYVARSLRERIGGREAAARVASVTFNGKRRIKEPAVEFLGDAASYCWQTGKKRADGRSSVLTH